jgi:tetratricopeptide (TPR) repeat protein
MYWHWNRHTPEGLQMAETLAKELIEMDPSRPEGYAQLGYHHISNVIGNRSQSPEKSIKRAEQYAQKALQLDESYGWAIQVMGWVHVFRRQHDLAIAEFEKLVALEPNGAEAHNCLGGAFLFAGRREDAIRHLEMGIRLDPYPHSWGYSFLGLAYASSILQAGPKDLDKAMELCKKALKVYPNDHVAHRVLILIYSYQNRMEEARTHVSELLKIIPNFSIKVAERSWLGKDKEELKRALELLRKAGITEG